MHPRDCLTGWWALTRWIQDARTEQDLGISRALLKDVLASGSGRRPVFRSGG